MRYYALINRKFKYVKVYTVKKKVHGNTNAVAKFVSSFLNRRFGKNVQKGGV